MKVDILIIGQGLAGSLLAWELLQHGCKIMIVDNGEENASQIAAGLINPVTGIRLVKAPEIDALLPVANQVYAELANHFQQTFYIEKPMQRILRNANEADYAAKRLADPAYRDYLAEIDSADTRPTPFGLVQQNRTGYLLTQTLLACLKNYFIAKDCYQAAAVDYSHIELGDPPRWQDISTKHIIFCEGYLATRNPWFSWLPFRPVKGEILTLNHQAKLPDNILNNGHWLIPTTDQQIRVGATFDRENLNALPTEAGKNELLDTLQTLTPGLSADVIEHKANIRPCTADRKPFIGRHPHNPQFLIFNGFGAKGSLQIPWYSQQFADHLLTGSLLPANCDITKHSATAPCVALPPTSLQSSATAPCVALDRCSKRDSISPILGVVPPASLQSSATAPASHIAPNVGALDRCSRRDSTSLILGVVPPASLQSKRISLLSTAHELLAEHLQPGDIAIDATLGNGYDTLFLAQHVGPEGRVFGFDIQSSALQSTQKKCLQVQLQERVDLIQDSHANMTEHIPDSLHGRISAIMFNLGYLPGGDKTIITQCDSTLIALNAAIALLSPTGMLTLLAYPGHQGGDQETGQVTYWCKQLNTAHFNVKIHYSAINKDSAPRLFVINKIPS